MVKMIWRFQKEGGVVISIPAGLSESQIETAKAKNINALFFLVASSGTDMDVLAGCLSQGIIKPYVSEVFNWSQSASLSYAL